MWESIYEQAVRWGLPDWGETELERGIYAGLWLAAAIVVLLLVLLLVLKIIFRRKSLSGISLKRENGDIFIARQAVQTALFQLAEANPALEILKVELYRRHRAPAPVVTVLYDPAGGTFDAVASEFQRSALAMLKESFGIDTVKEVQIRLAKVPPRSRFAHPASGGEKALPNHENPAGF